MPSDQNKGILNNKDEDWRVIESLENTGYILKKKADKDPKKHIELFCLLLR